MRPALPTPTHGASPKSRGPSFFNHTPDLTASEWHKTPPQEEAGDRAACFLPCKVISKAQRMGQFLKGSDLWLLRLPRKAAK